jgi:hypothetical protein
MRGSDWVLVYMQPVPHHAPPKIRLGRAYRSCRHILPPRATSLSEGGDSPDLHRRLSFCYDAGDVVARRRRLAENEYEV